MLSSSALLLGLVVVVFADNVCEYGTSRYLGPQEEDGEEFEVPDDVTSSIPVVNKDGGKASPRDLLIAGREVTFEPETWVKEDRRVTLVFTMYRASDELSAFKQIRLRGEGMEKVKASVSSDGDSWSPIGEVDRFDRNGMASWKLGGADCQKECNGVAGGFIMLEIFGLPRAIPSIRSVSILGCQALKGARSPSCMTSCTSQRINPKFGSHGISVTSNVKFASGSGSDLLSGTRLTFDKADWEAKKENAFLEFDLKRMVLVGTFILQTEGVQSGTLYFSDDLNSGWSKTTRMPYQAWEIGLAFDLHDYAGKCSRGTCSGIAGRYVRIQLRGSGNQVPTISNPFIVTYSE